MRASACVEKLPFSCLRSIQSDRQIISCSACKCPIEYLRYIGLAESLEHVQCKLRDDGPYDGVLGFSQGATLAVLLCLLTPPPTPSRMAGPAIIKR